MENLQGGTLALDHRYHIEQRLGTYGLTTLYAGSRDPFDLPVQIAVYDGLLEAGAAPAVVDAIQDAAERASRLDGEGLLSVIDFGEIEEGVPFVIERRIGGTTLADRLETNGVFDPEQVADFVDRIADLLESAQRHGVCHGNLKPIWISFPDEQAPLSEAHLSHFGLGPSMSELVDMPQAVLTTELVDGFPPEAFEVAPRTEDDGVEVTADDADPGAHLTPKADQWGLAALAYRLLVGVHPFFDDPVDASDGILRIKTEEPPSLREMGVEPHIADVVDRALRSDPDRRWRSVSDFAAELQAAVDQPAGGESPGDSGPRPVVDGQPDDGEETAGTEGDPGFAGDTPQRVDPKPSGYLLTFAVVALLLSNVGWFFHSLSPEQPDDETPAAEAPPQPETLPSGLQLRTDPPRADLIAIDDQTEELLGTTPRVIPDDRLDNGSLRLLIRRDDYRDQFLTVEDTDAGRDILVELIEEPDTE